MSIGNCTHSPPLEKKSTFFFHLYYTNVVKMMEMIAILGIYKPPYIPKQNSAYTPFPEKTSANICALNPGLYLFKKFDK